MRTIALILTVASLAACSENETTGLKSQNSASESLTYGEYLLSLAFKQKPPDYSRAFALVKFGVAGPDWLATFHGLPNNQNACEETILPYKSDPSLTVIAGEYYCVEISDDFSIGSLVAPAQPEKAS